jgi:ParB/RepB/Spo0J family partition protein
MTKEEAGQNVPVPVVTLLVAKIMTVDNPSRHFPESVEDKEKFDREIKATGILEPLLVLGGVDGKYLLAAGHRRLASAKRLGIREVPVRVLESKNEPVSDTLFNVNLKENVHRKNLSGMEVALDIQELRARKKWKGGDNTKHVARFLGVSPAYVTQHEKLLTLAVDQQRKVHDGMLAKEAAWDIAGMDVSDEIKERILGKAAVKAKEEEEEKEKVREKKAKKVVGGREKRTGLPKLESKKKREARIEKKHVEKALREEVGESREVRGAVKKSRKVRMRLIGDFVLLLDTAFLDTGMPGLEAFGKLWIGWVKGEISDTGYVEGMQALLK